MSKDWEKNIGTIKAAPHKKDSWINKDGYASGGTSITPPDKTESQTVEVKGTRALRKDKKPVKATWY
jgi:hypothetical protein